MLPIDLTPKLNFGVVQHRRFRPAKNAFAYSVFTISVPMRERRRNPALLRQHGLGDNQFRFFSFFDKDHGRGDADSLAWAEELLASHGIAHPDGEIWLQTFPRVLAYVFNPVSFWICTKPNGQVRAVIAEVNNTFGERHCYLLSKDSGESLHSGETLTTNKVFHVSPFCDVSGEYRFRFLFAQESQSGRNTVNRIELHEDGQSLIHTSISGQAHPLTRTSLYFSILRYPLMSIGVIGRIHWQALKLWAKGVPFHSKPKPPDFEVSR
jgi:uncharacterized protein